MLERHGNRQWRKWKYSPCAEACARLAAEVIRNQDGLARPLSTHVNPGILFIFTITDCPFVLKGKKVFTLI